MKSLKFILFFFPIFLFLINNLSAQSLVYIDMDKILQKSKAGKVVMDNLKKTNENNIKKFKKIEDDIKEQEQDLVSKRNVMSQEDFEKSLIELRKKISDYRETRQKAINEVAEKRINASADFAIKIKPILADYAKEKNIDIVVQKKNIIMGKSELDITDEILKIVDKEISKLKVN